MTRLCVYPLTSVVPLEEKVHLTLVEAPDGSRITLRAVDSRGRIAGPGNLMSIYANGTFKLIPAGKMGGRRFEETF